MSDRGDLKKDELRDISDRLLRGMDELKQLEREKRAEPISSPQFKRLARVIEIKSRDIRTLAADELAIGEQIEVGEQDTVEDVEPHPPGQ
jgi:hypothetical protein